MSSLSVLAEIKEVDDKIKTLTAQKEEDLPKPLEAPLYKLNTAKREYNSIKDKYQQVLEHYQALEQQKEDINNRALKLQEKLRVASSQEYNRLLREQTKLKKVLSINERKIESTRNKLESLKSVLDTKKATYDKFAEEYENIFIDVKDKISQVNELLDILKIRRKRLLANMDTDTLNIYNSAYKTGNGIAVALLNENRCQACNMTLPPNLVNRIHRGTEIMTCPNCGRILITAEQKNGEKQA